MKQKYDNQAMRDVKKAKRAIKREAKINELVKKGHRLNPAKASNVYKDAVMKHGSKKDKLGLFK